MLLLVALGAALAPPQQVIKASIAPEQKMVSLALPMADASRAVLAVPRTACRTLADDCNTLIASFKAIQARTAAREPPNREPSLDFVHDANLRLDLECNPNIYPDPFKARVSVRIRAADIDVTSEVALTTLVDALRNALADNN